MIGTFLIYSIGSLSALYTAMRLYMDYKNARKFTIRKKLFRNTVRLNNAVNVYFKQKKEQKIRKLENLLNSEKKKNGLLLKQFNEVKNKNQKLEESLKSEKKDYRQKLVDAYFKF